MTYRKGDWRKHRARAIAKKYGRGEMGVPAGGPGMPPKASRPKASRVKKRQMTAEERARMMSGDGRDLSPTDHRTESGGL